MRGRRRQVKNWEGVISAAAEEESEFPWYTWAIIVSLSILAVSGTVAGLSLVWNYSKYELYLHIYMTKLKR